MMSLSSISLNQVPCSFSVFYSVFFFLSLCLSFLHFSCYSSLLSLFLFIASLPTTCASMYFLFSFFFIILFPNHSIFIFFIHLFTTSLKLFSFTHINSFFSRFSTACWAEGRERSFDTGSISPALLQLVESGQIPEGRALVPGEYN